MGLRQQPRQRILMPPAWMVGAEAELLLQLQRRDAVGMGRHQVGRPEPHGQRQLRAVQHGARGHRGLALAGGALEGPGLGRQRPPLDAAAGRADEAVRRNKQRAAVSQAAQAAGSGKRRWNSSSERGKSAMTASGVVFCSLFVLPRPAPLVTTYCGTGPSGISLFRGYA